MFSFDSKPRTSAVRPCPLLSPQRSRNAPPVTMLQRVPARSDNTEATALHEVAEEMRHYFEPRAPSTSGAHWAHLTSASAAGAPRRQQPIQTKCECGARATCPKCAVQRAPDTRNVPEIEASQGTPLPEPLQANAESAFQADFSRVRMHVDAPAATAARNVGARAFTVDSNIYFGPGFYRPETREGRELIGHELTHVLQQRRGLSAVDLQGPEDAYEREADAMGRAFAQGGSARISTPIGGARGVQRSQDPGAQAERVGVADSPYGLPFLGEASSMDELRSLMMELAAAAGVPTLGLVREDLAMSSVPSAIADASSAPAETTAAQASLQAKRIQAKRIQGKPIQRSVVAGCYVPGAPPNVIGMAAHRQIEYACMGGAAGCVGELAIPGDGRADLVRQWPGPLLPEIGEIKPASWIGAGLTGLAAVQLAGYLTAYQAAFGIPAVPMWSYIFPGGPFLMNPAQRLTAWGPSGGLYFYRCSGVPRRRVRVPVRVPNPVPVVVPAPSTAPANNTARDVGRGVAVVGAGIGIGYLIYRGVRMIPSLFPPLWPTIPANALVP